MPRHKLIIFLLFSIFLSINNALAGKALFDDFSSNYLDASKWQQRTFVREIVNEQFVSQLGNRSPGMDAEIAPGIFRNNLSFKNPNSINSIECDVTIVETKLDSALNSSSFARVGGYFYNIKPTGGATGDIFAHIMIGDRGNGGLEAFWEVQEILSDDTKTWRVIGSGTIIGPGTLEYDSAYKLRISYYENKKFSFSVDGQTTPPFIGAARKRGPVSSLKALSTGINTTNGLNDGFVFAKFDTVYINDDVVVYDDFSTSPLDLSNWQNFESVRKISNGSLHSYQQGLNERQQRTTHLTEVDCPFFEAKTRISSGSQLSGGADGIARIQGYFYNDSRGPGSGKPYNRYEGDVFVQIRLQYYSDGSLRARAIVSRSDSADETSYTDLVDQDFTPPSLDNDYILSIRYTGSHLILKCNDEEVTHNISTPTYKPYGEHRALRTRINLDSGESGYMKALFDDLYIEKKGKLIPAMPLLLLAE